MSVVITSPTLLPCEWVYSVAIVPGPMRNSSHRSRWLEFLMGPGTIATEYTHSHGNKVGEVMTTDIKTVDENAAIEEIVELMERYRIKRVPVTVSYTHLT